MGGAFGSNEFQILLGKLGINLDVMEIGFSLAPIAGSLASRCSRQSVSRRPVFEPLSEVFSATRTSWIRSLHLGPL